MKLFLLMSTFLLLNGLARAQAGGVPATSDRLPVEEPKDTKAAAPEKEEVNVIKTDGSEIGMTIVGAIVHKDRGQENVALIKENTGRIKAVKKDFKVMEKYIVHSIHEKYIELASKDGQRYLVYQNKFAREFASTERSGQTSKVNSVLGEYREDGFERVKDKVKMSGAYRDKLINEDLAKILMQATAEPHYQGSQIVGFLITQIDKDSIYDKGGIVDGDVITNINGNQLGSVAGAISLLKSLKSADTIQMQILRGDQPMNINIEIK